MTRRFLLSLIFGILVCFGAQAQTSLSGKIIDASNSEELIAANIVIKKNGVFITGTSTDLEGNYKVVIDPGTYEVEVSYTGYPEQLIQDVRVIAGKDNALDIEMSNEGGIDLGEVVITTYKVPLIEQDKTSGGSTITSKEIRQLSTRNVNALAATTAGLSSVDEGGAVTVRGSRSNATNYYLDGIRVFGSMPPESEIEQLQVITGGIGAQYGDVTGGIISVTSKGPSRRLSGGIEMETSGLDVGDNYIGLDKFGQSLIGASVSGPIIKKKTEEDGLSKSILGFRFSGRYTFRKDDAPAATGVYVARDEVRQALEENPIDGNIINGETLRNEDVYLSDIRPNEEQKRIDLTGKLDLRLTDNVDLTFTGTYLDVTNKFTPGGWRLLNHINNPTTYSKRYRGIVRFRQKFGNTLPQEGEEGANRNALIRGFQYTLQGGFERGNSETYDPVHEDRLFNYGYVGKFDFERIPFVGNDTTGIMYIDTTDFTPHFISHIAFSPDILTGYSPDAYGAPVNPGLQLYNEVDGNEEIEIEDFNIRNGLITGGVNNIWDGLHTNVNQVYNSFSKSETDIITGSARIGFDIVPSGSDKGVHNISLGFLYEQRISRGYSVNPNALWILARQLENQHIDGVDTNRVLGSINIQQALLSGDVQFRPDQALDLLSVLNSGVETIPLYGKSFQNIDGGVFYRALRDRFGLSLDDFAYVDGLDPGELSLDLFAPQELTNYYSNGTLINYFGYDYLGNKLNSDVTFDDFFTARETRYGEEIRSLPVAPFRPIYLAGFIQDKFKFKDIIFRVGVRLDRYDANTKVLKDPLSLYEITSARDFYATVGAGKERPAAVEDDFLVYVDQDGVPNPNVEAFRRGEQWYFADGSIANDPILIYGEGGSLIIPYYKEQDATKRNIQADGFDPSTSFEDYEAEVNVMPRLAFSFPISDVANFFAHYDILVQRPTSNVYASPLNYFYFTDANRTPSANPNLKPAKTIDYEVGFQQKLSNSSALKMLAYYREMRSMIQSRQYQFLPFDQVVNYNSFGNLDFGTVKGFTLQYDLRRTNNVQLTVNYTLQFADGTGSSSTSQRNAVDKFGNIRTLFPLSFDERHRLNATIDYRFPGGREYRGPRIGELALFANAGVNLQAIMASGRPYTATTRPTQFGGAEVKGTFNGARLPWNSTVNLRVDKNFVLSKSEKRPMNLNIYLRAQNLLDTRNVLGVYSATGSPDDDGFLASPDGQNEIATVESEGRNVAAYQDAYNWAMVAPGFFSLPRRMYVGAIIDF